MNQTNDLDKVLIGKCVLHALFLDVGEAQLAPKEYDKAAKAIMPLAASKDRVCTPRTCCGWQVF
jgi:hypothetical protein